MCNNWSKFFQFSGWLLVWHSHTPSVRKKSKGSGDTYQFSWNAISYLVVKFGSCRSLVSQALGRLHGQQLLFPRCCIFCSTSASQHPPFVNHYQFVAIWYAAPNWCTRPFAFFSAEGAWLRQMPTLYLSSYTQLQQVSGCGCLHTGELQVCS